MLAGRQKCSWYCCNHSLVQMMGACARALALLILLLWMWLDRLLWAVQGSPSGLGIFILDRRKTSSFHPENHLFPEETGWGERHNIESKWCVRERKVEFSRRLEINSEARWVVRSQSLWTRVGYILQKAARKHTLLPVHWHVWRSYWNIKGFFTNHK